MKKHIQNNVKIEEDLQKEIDSNLTRLQLEAKEIRKRAGLFPIFSVLALVVSFLLVYEFPQVSFLFFIWGLAVIFGGIFIIIGIWVLIYPLAKEEYAFRKIAEAIGVLEGMGDKKEAILYKKAYRDVEKAYEILKKMQLNTTIPWYKTTNKMFRRFLKNLYLIVLPAIKEYIIKTEHLEKIALAICDSDRKKIFAVNKMLETEPIYKKSTIKYVRVKKGVLRQILEFLKTPNILGDVLIVVLLFSGCVFSYFVVVNYLGISKDVAFGTVAVVFATLAGVRFARRPSRA